MSTNPQHAWSQHPVGPHPAVPPGAALGRYFAVVRRHIVLAMTTAVIITTLGVFRAYRARPIYEAAARVLVERQAPRPTKFEEVSQPALSWWAPEFYKTQEGLITSRPVLTLAAEDPSLADLWAPRAGEETAPARPRVEGWQRVLRALWGRPPDLPPERWEILRGLVRAKQQLDTHFIVIRASHSNPWKAMRIANAVARAYVQYVQQRRMEISSDAFLYLQEQKIKAEKALAEAEDRLQQFREQSTISSLEAGREDHPILRRLGQLNAEMTEKQLERITVEAQVRAIRQALQKKEVSSDDENLYSLPVVQGDNNIVELRRMLVVAENELASLEQIYGPEHPRIQTAQAGVAVLRSRLRDALNNVVEATQVRLAMLADEEKALRREYEEQNALALDLARDALTFERLSHEVERQRRLYQVLIDRMSEVEITAEYGRTNVELVEEAIVPRLPVRPNKPRMIWMSLVIGVLAGMAAAWLREHLDQTLRTPNDLEERLGIPVLGFVPWVKGAERDELQNPHRQQGSSPIAEAFRHVRTNLFLSGHASQLKTLVVTSAGPGEGKTTVACNLAYSIALTRKRTLLVDADFRQPAIHRFFHLDNDMGLSSLLTGQNTFDEIVQKAVLNLDAMEFLDVITCGPYPPHPTELLGSEEFARLLQEWRQRYDRIILDTPPLLLFSDGMILGALADGVVLVAQAARSPVSQVLRAKKQLEKARANLLGGVLNAVRVHQLGHYYSDYYHYGYARSRAKYYAPRPTAKSDEPRISPPRNAP